MLITETKIRIMALFYFVLQSILSFNQNKKKDTVSESIQNR